MLRAIAALARPVTAALLPGVDVWVAPWPAHRTDAHVVFVRRHDGAYAMFPSQLVHS